MLLLGVLGSTWSTTKLKLVTTSESILLIESIKGSISPTRKPRTTTTIPSKEVSSKPRSEVPYTTVTIVLVVLIPSTKERSGTKGIVKTALTFGGEGSPTLIPTSFAFSTSFERPTSVIMGFIFELGNAFEQW